MVDERELCYGKGFWVQGYAGVPGTQGADNQFDRHHARSLVASLLGMTQPSVLLKRGNGHACGAHVDLTHQMRSALRHPELRQQRGTLWHSDGNTRHPLTRV